jgi:signal transduction histidine kinase/DNA-binding response OmpR family regulator
MAHILVVDDEAANRKLFTTILGYHGHQPIEAADGREALDLVRSERPDLVISDVLMPTMDGYAFVLQLRADPDAVIARTPVILSTSTYPEAEARALAHACGVDWVIAKPAEPEQVLRLVDIALDAPGAVTPSGHAAHSELPLTEKLSERLVALTARMNAVLDAALEMASESDRDRLLARFVGVARDIIGAQHAAVGILGDDDATARPLYTSGVGEPEADRLWQLLSVHGLPERVLNERHTCRLRDLELPDTTESPHDAALVRCFLGTPIASATSSHLLGWLCLADKLDAAEFSDEDERLAVALAAQVAVAYENATLLAEARRRAADLEHEVAERKRAEESLRRTLDELSRSNTELERFAYVASHHLQEPLRQIATYAQLLARSCGNPLDDDTASYVRYTTEGVKRMRALLNDLLAHSRVAVGPPAAERVDCAALLARLCDSWHAVLEENGAIVTAGALPTVVGDAEQLHELFAQLVDNALKFRGREPLRIRIDAGREGEEWRFAVSDNGIGIAPEYAERIFNVFERLHGADYPGTGIGLAISRRIVERHGGRIWVESDSGNGATFYFTIPATGDPELDASNAATRSPS